MLPRQIKNILTSSRSGRPEPWPPYQDKIYQPFIPKLVEDGEVDGEGDGSDAYNVRNEEGERWQFSDSQLKSTSTISR